MERHRPSQSEELREMAVRTDDYGYAAIDAISTISFVRIVAWRAGICN